MSEPTYRVDLRHDPSDAWPWQAVIVRLADEREMSVKLGNSREDAFACALEAVVSFKQQQHPSSVYLSEDGDLLDPHEVQR